MSLGAFFVHLVGTYGLQSNPSASNGEQVPDLNDRQRAYLLAIFETDQEVETEMRELPYRPFQQRPKASEWRWLEYKDSVPPDVEAPEPSPVGLAIGGRS
jgi:hypothetical protein